ncbi:MAG: hypothetical protein WC462_01970 [archaeon]
MGLGSSLKGIYYFFEDKWYDVLDKIDGKAPIYKVIDPIDKVVPSFVLFLLLVLFMMVFVGYLIQFNSPYDVTFTTIDAKTNKTLPTVKLSGTINGDLFSEITGSDGTTILTISGNTRNTYEMLGQMIFPSEEDVSAIISAEKTGYNKVKDQEVNLSSRNAQISLSPVPADFSYPDSTIAELIDSGSGVTIIDSTGVAEIVFKCNNKNISEKIVKDNDDGALDGEFTLNEPNCEFIAVEASAPGYEPLSGVSKPLPASKNSISLTAYPAGTGTAMVFVSEKSSSPKKMIPGINISFLDSVGGTAANARTDNGGVSMTSLLPGTYTVIASIFDGTYLSIDVDQRKTITISAGVSSSIEIEMEKVDPRNIRYLRIKVLEESDHNTPVQGAKLFIQYTSTDVNGTYVTGESGENCITQTGIESKSCLTDSSGIVSMNTNVIYDGKRVASIYKDGYVYKFIKPVFFKIGEGPEIVYLEKVSGSNSGFAKVSVKSKSDQRALYGAEASLYYNSSSLRINEIHVRKDPLLTNSAGASLFTGLPAGTYFASAKLSGIVSDFSAKKSLDVNQTINLDVNINLNASFVRIRLVNYNQNSILNASTATVKLFSDSEKFSSIPSSPTEVLAYQSGYFVSAGYERLNHLLVTIDLSGYASNFIEIPSGTLNIGENNYTVRLYPVSMLDNNVNVFFNGLYDSNTYDAKSNRFLGILNKEGKYFARIDAVINKDLSYSDLFGSIIFNNKAWITNMPYHTPLFYKDNEIYASAPVEQTPNPDSYYIRNNSVSPGRQAGIQWQGTLVKGTYNFVVEFSMDNAKDNDFLDINFSAKEKHSTIVSEDKGRISFKVGAPVCDSSLDSNCPKLFFDVKINSIDTNSSSYPFENDSKKFYKNDSGTAKIEHDTGNTLEVSLYNNSVVSMTDVNVRVYSYSGAIESFSSGTLSDKIKFDSLTGASSKTVATMSLSPYSRNYSPITNFYSSAPNVTSYIVIEAQTSDGNYLLFINTKSTARKLKLIGAKFLAGVMDQKFDGEVFGLPGNVPVGISGVFLEAKRNCKTTNSTNVFSEWVSTGDINGNYFSKIINDIYAYKTDCLDVDVYPTDSSYENLSLTLPAGSGGIMDQSLACVKAYFPSSIGELEPKETSINWNTDANLVIKSTCPFPVSLSIESGLVMTNNCPTGSLSPNKECNVLIKGVNKGYSSSVSFSDILGVFPIYVKAKNANTSKKYSIAETLKVHVSNPNECFAISKDVFNLYETNPETGFTINNSCQYTAFEDYYIPKASSAFEGVDLDSFAPKYDNISISTNFGDYTIYPVEGMTYVLKNFGKVSNSGVVDEMRQYCQKIKTIPVGFTYPETKTQLNSTGKVYWTKAQTMPKAGIGSAEEYCQQGFFEGQPGYLLSPFSLFKYGYISDSEFDELMTAISSTLYSWAGNDITKGFWTGDCFETNIKPDYTLFEHPDGFVSLGPITCTALVRGPDGTILPVPASPTDSNHYLPLCGAYTLMTPSTLPTSTDCTGLSITENEKTNDAVLAAKQKYCLYNKQGLAGFLKGFNEGSHVFWVTRQFMPATGIGSAEEHCQKGFFEGITGDIIRSNYVSDEAGPITTKEISDLLVAMTSTPFPWIGFDLSKGFWTGDCVGAGSCYALVRKSNGEFELILKPVIESSRFSPLCATYAPFDEAPSVEECNEWVKCTYYDEGELSSGGYNVCQLNEGVELGKTSTDNTIQIKSVKANGSTKLIEGSVIVWIEGNLLKARFVGQNYSGYSDRSIETGVISTGVSGDQYGVINIVDYVN